MGSFEETLPCIEGLPSPHSSSLLLLLEQVLWKPAIEATPASLAKSEAVAVIAQVHLADSTLESVPH